MPNPPNFNRTAAKNMEPITGASTWAFGSHIWKNIIGSFTKNAKVKKIKIQLEKKLVKLISLTCQI